MHPAGADNMEMDDFGGALGGALGGLVKWHQDPARQATVTRVVTSILSSVVCGAGFGYLTHGVIQWQWPNVPSPVCVGLAFVAGLASGVLAQVAVGLVSEVTAIARTKIVTRMGQPSGPDPAAGTTRVAVPPAVVVGDRVPVGPVPGVDDGQRVAAGEAERAVEKAGG